MAELTPLETAHAIQDKVDALFKQYVLPSIEARIQQAVDARMPDAVKYVIGINLDRVVTQVVREEITGKLKLSVEVVE